jgi:hypothetical protein
MDLHDIVGLITKNKKMVPIYPYVYLFYDMFDIGDLTLKTVKKEVKIYVKTKIFEIIKQLIKHDANIGQGDSTTAKYF